MQRGDVRTARLHLGEAVWLLAPHGDSAETAEEIRALAETREFLDTGEFEKMQKQAKFRAYTRSQSRRPPEGGPPQT